MLTLKNYFYFFFLLHSHYSVYSQCLHAKEKPLFSSSLLFQNKNSLSLLNNSINNINDYRFLLPENEYFATPKASVFCHMENVVRNKTHVWLMLRLDNYDYQMQKKSFVY